MSKIDTKLHISMDDFKEMIAIEKEFGQIPLGEDLEAQELIKKNLKPKVNIYGVEKETKQSLWTILAKQIDNTPAKFTRFIKLIQRASLLNML